MLQNLLKTKIDLYMVNVHNPEGCCFIMFPDLVRSVKCSYLSICLVTFGVMWFFHTVLLACLQRVIVVFSDYIHFYSYSSILLIKTQKKSGIGVICGGEGVIMQFLEHRI